MYKWNSYIMQPTCTCTSNTVIVVLKPYRSKDTDSRYITYMCVNIHAGVTRRHVTYSLVCKC